MSKTTKEQREELKQHMEWMARRYHRNTANKYFLALLDDLEAAEQEIARLREQMQWRPIDEMDDQSINRQSHLSNIEIH